MGQIELNCVLNCILWDRAILTFNGMWKKLCCFWQLNCVFKLNWIVWNRTDYLYKNGFGVK